MEYPTALARRARLRGAAPLSALHSKPFLPVESVQLLVVHVYPFALQHQTGPAIAKAPPVCRDLVHALSDLLICLLLLAPHRLRIAPDQAADPGLRDLMAIQYVQSCSPAFSRTRQPFPNRSFRMELSSIWSARSLFSLAVLLLKHLEADGPRKRPCRHIWPSICRTGQG